MAQRAKTPLLWIDQTPIFQLCGAEDDGGSGSSGDGGSNNSNSGGQNGNGSQSGSGDQGQGSGQGAATKTYSQADIDALTARMTQADKNATAAQKRVEELEGASKSELEKAQAALKAAQDENSTLKEGQKSMLISNAFLTVKDAPVWHNSGAALALLDKSLLTVSDDGKVAGMEAAVTKLKDEHPYLVKPADGKKDDKGKGGGQQGGGQQNGGQASGSSNNGAGGGGGGKDRKVLEGRFPGLRGR